jgi:hypothetical protein
MHSLTTRKHGSSRSCPLQVGGIVGSNRRCIQKYHWKSLLMCNGFVAPHLCCVVAAAGGQAAAGRPQGASRSPRGAAAKGPRRQAARKVMHQLRQCKGVPALGQPVNPEAAPISGAAGCSTKLSSPEGEREPTSIWPGSPAAGHSSNEPSSTDPSSKLRGSVSTLAGMKLATAWQLSARIDKRQHSAGTKSEVMRHC